MNVRTGNSSTSSVATPEAMLAQRYSEPYSPTGGLAAVGVLNQLGRPDIEPLEVLVREAVQNCWDAKRGNAPRLTVEIGRFTLDSAQARFCRDEVLVDPPPGLALREELAAEISLLYFADFGTHGLGGPTRADQTGSVRDFVDFIRNIGQPPDTPLGAGSFGYGKAAFYIASRAKTIIVDTLCAGDDGQLERRFIGCALGNNFALDGRPFTGRHWWGRAADGIVEPLTGDAARAAAAGLGLPNREASAGLGTTVAVVCPDLSVDDEGVDETMEFVAEALAWNFWPRMIDTRGAGRRTMEFRVLDQGVQVRIPNPRADERLRAFAEAFDRLREDPGADEEFLVDRSVESLRPRQSLGRLIVQRGPITPVAIPDRSVPVGARLTADSVHHVALMRNAELVVRYLEGPAPVATKAGYSGVFRCSLAVDSAFRAAEPPTHDDWIHRAISDRRQRSFVKIALERIQGICREVAGYGVAGPSATAGADVPLGEFADSLGLLIPSADGPGARRQVTPRDQPRRRRRAPGRTVRGAVADDVWTDGAVKPRPEASSGRTTGGSEAPGDTGQPVLRPPQLRIVGDPQPVLAHDGTPVIRYPFQLRARGNTVKLDATIEVMSSDGGQVESEAPVGAASPRVLAWTNPAGDVILREWAEAEADTADGEWAVDVSLTDETMMRVDVNVVAI